MNIILSPEAKEVYRYLNQEASDSKTERIILKAVNQKFELIKENPHVHKLKSYFLRYGSIKFIFFNFGSS